MSDLVLLLALKRRSGVLAGAVAALGRASLGFVSQRIEEGEHGPVLRLTARGEVTDPDALIALFTAVGGVAEVVDILVDGDSLLHLPPEPEPVVTLADAPPVASEPADSWPSPPAPEVRPPIDADPGLTATREPHSPGMVTDIVEAPAPGWTEATAKADPGDSAPPLVAVEALAAWRVSMADAEDGTASADAEASDRLAESDSEPDQAPLEPNAVDTEDSAADPPAAAAAGDATRRPRLSRLRRRRLL